MQMNDASDGLADDGVEYYPRNQRAPYLFDVSQFGLRPSSSSRRTASVDGGDLGWDLINEEGDGAELSASPSSRTPTKSSSSSNLSQHQMRRRSSFARVFSTLGMSPGPGTIAEDEGAENSAGADGGLDDAEADPNSLLPPRFRRGSSAEAQHLLHRTRRFSVDSLGGASATERLGSQGNLGATSTISRIPRWALQDESAIVLKDGAPIPVGTLLHQHSLLSRATAPHYIVTPTWRLKERMKTVGVCLVLALNIGTDPPDLNRPTPCARLQCWLDPTTISRAKAKERIGERLEQQYARWQQRSKLKYRRALDPTVDTVRDLCLRMRESARGERVLLHYNGHGVPRPTANGEIWLFDKHHTNYIPLSVTDLRRWIGKPSVVVLDCSGAGVLMPFFTTPLNEATAEGGVGGGTPYNRSSSATLDQSDPIDTEAGYLRAIRDTIVLCPTAQGEWLPLNPLFPADIFTSCLTTPIPIALRWFVHQTPLTTQDLDIETIADSIPGKLTDRKTPLGELNWVFTAITDTIAWHVLPSPLFQRLFRQDLLLASMFRNFLLADRILRSLNCTPSSYPELPSTCNHPLWQAWDLAVETCLAQLIDAGHLKKGTVGGSIGIPKPEEKDGSETERQPPARQATAASPSAPAAAFPEVNAPFFAEQLTAFELWLEWASSKPRSKLVIRCPPGAVGGTPLPFLQGKEDPERMSHELDPPQELPIVLQVLLSQAHRVRALVLLRRFLDLGPSACNLALSVGIFPYVLKLLQSPIDEYKHVLIGIWARVVGFDPSCQEDVVKDRALPHFVRHLRWGLASSQTEPSVIASVASLQDASEQRTMAAFILSVICSGYTLGQNECINEKLHTTCNLLLQSLESPDEAEQNEAKKNLTPEFRMWLLICLGNLAKDNASAQAELYKAGLHFRLFARLEDDTPDVRTASCYALGSLVGSAPPKPIESEATVPSLSSPPMLGQQLQSQLKSAPQAMAPMGLMPGTTMAGGLLGTPQIGGMNVSLGNPSPSLAPQGLMASTLANPSQGLPGQFRPQPGASLSGMPAPSQGGGGLAQHGNQPPMMFSNLLSASPSPPLPMPQLAEAKTVYEDHQRLDMDLSAAVKLGEAIQDASPAARFEAMLALNRFVGKYLEAFVAVAGNDAQGRSVLGGSMPAIPMPEEMADVVGVEEKMAQIWRDVVKLQRSDPFVSLRELARSTVVCVNKRAMAEKSKLRQLRSGSKRRGSLTSSSVDEKNDPPPTLAGRRSATGVNLASYSPQVGSPPKELQRAGSAGGVARAASSPRKGYNQTFPQFESTPAEPFFYPESMFFEWKKAAWGSDKDEIVDPLSDEGQMKRYRSTRNDLMRQKGALLKENFAALAERPSRMTRSPYAYEESEAAARLEKEIEEKKDALQQQQVSLLRNSGARSTSLLRFHPYEPALVVCGSSDNISVWNAQTSERMTSFSNSNSKSTRMTSALWVNETSTSLLLTGGSDGTVRLFDGLFEPNDEMSREKPSLVSSFVAAPDIVTDKRYSSGLVLEFQQCRGQLIAGGNTKEIRCWDVVTEKCVNAFEGKGEASLTTLTSAWNYDMNSGYSGLGPDIVVAGYGNGSLRVYDTRSSRGDPALFVHERPPSRRRKYSAFDEHSSWIIDVSFTTYGGRHEIVSGCVAGSIKFWDLRYSSAVRTIDHKMQMTALAAHSNVPMFATGSPAQFIKIMSHDGMTQQVIRYHEKNPGQRIGPVSCLSFHPHMPFMAAGFADEHVSLYAPKGTSL